MESRQGENRYLAWRWGSIHKTPDIGCLTIHTARGRRGAVPIRFAFSRGKGHRASSPEIALRLSNSSATPLFFGVSLALLLAFSRQTPAALRSASAPPPPLLGCSENSSDCEAAGKQYGPTRSTYVQICGWICIRAARCGCPARSCRAYCCNSSFKLSAWHYLGLNL